MPPTERERPVSRELREPTVTTELKFEFDLPGRNDVQASFSGGGRTLEKSGMNHSNNVEHWTIRCDTENAEQIANILLKVASRLLEVAKRTPGAAVLR